MSICRDVMDMKFLIRIEHGYRNDCHTGYRYGYVIISDCPLVSVTVIFKKGFQVSTQKNDRSDHNT